MANKMYPRGMASHLNASDGSVHQIVNFSNLNTFENETVKNINDLMDHVNHLHHRMSSVEELIKFADWVKELYPELVRAYATSERVAKRLTDDTPAEQCEAQA